MPRRSNRWQNTRQTAVQRAINRSTGVNYTNEGQIQGRKNASMRAYADAYGMKIRSNARGERYLSPS